MKPWIKWTLGGVALLALALAGLVLAGRQMAETRRTRHIDVKVPGVAYATDASALERGRYLFMSRGCAECHGANGGGREFVNDGKGTRIAGPNITPGGATAAYQPADWERVVRHGVKPNGQPVFIMPSEDYNRFTDDDLAALVGFVRTLAPRPGDGRVMALPLPAMVLYGWGLIPDAAQRIDHSLAPSKPVAQGVTVAHGAYVATMCIGCHGNGLSGGRIAGGPPDWPAAANLTPGEGSVMTTYPDAQAFVAMLRSGKRPNGTAIQVMPFGSLRELSDIDAQAVYAFLKTVPAKPSGQH
jgi:mono/diheme cytochrome c family protein